MLSNYSLHTAMNRNFPSIQTKRNASGGIAIPNVTSAMFNLPRPKFEVRRLGELLESGNKTNRKSASELRIRSLKRPFRGLVKAAKTKLNRTVFASSCGIKKQFL